jgi:hypothetical protein
MQSTSWTHERICHRHWLLWKPARVLQTLGLGRTIFDVFGLETGYDGSTVYFGSAGELVALDATTG